MHGQIRCQVTAIFGQGKFSQNSVGKGLREGDTINDLLGVFSA